MAFGDRIREKLHKQDTQQLKAEFLWLLGRMDQYKGKILTVGLLGMVGTLMGLASSVASKYLIDAVTGHGSGILIQAAVAMALLMLGFHAWAASLFPAGVFMQLLAVILAQTLVETVVYLPFAWVDTMVIEQKYGFNKMTKKTFVMHSWSIAL